MSAVVGSFTDHAEKLLELHLILGVYKCFIWFKGKLQGNNVALIEEGYSFWRGIPYLSHILLYVCLQGCISDNSGWTEGSETQGEMCSLSRGRLNVTGQGQRFKFSEHERIKLKVYYANTDCWKAVAGAPLPEQICKPFSINCCEPSIYVVGKNLHVAVGHISRKHSAVTSENRWTFSVQWQVVDAPTAFFDLVPTSAQAGVYECAVHIEELNILLSRSCPECWEEHRQSERVSVRSSQKNTGNPSIDYLLVSDT